MFSVCIYGAGALTQKVLPQLSQNLRIEYILDKSPEKANSKLDGVIIKPVNKQNVNNSPIIISIYDIAGAISSLLDVGCQQTIYFFRFDESFNYFSLWKYIHNDDEINENILNSLNEKPIYFHSKEFDITQSSIHYLNNNDTDDQKPRIFNLLLNIEDGNPAGPIACRRNLRLANDIYHLIPNFNTIALNECYVNPVAGSTKTLPDSQNYNEFMKIIHKHRYNIPFNLVLAEYNRHFHYWESLKNCNEMFRFTQDDLYLFQDAYTAHIFICMFPEINKIACVNHAQGTIGYEVGNGNDAIAEYFNDIQTAVLQRIKQWIFPAQGAVCGFASTSTKEMRDLIGNNIVSVAYNGYEPKTCLNPDESFLKIINNIPKDTFVFATTTKLGYPKGVERIPKLLACLKAMSGCNVLWVLISGGGAMEKEVENQIEKHLQPDDYIWFKERFDNQDNVFALFERADFYIMTHRVSIFDLATLQAMSYGCVPVLSDVGGNKEFCRYDNGVLFDADNINLNALFTAINPYLDSSDYLILQKEKNKKVVSDVFSNRNFLRQYRDILVNI
jgi:glycosyltransferase involved in cell wall biosynthesis